METYEQAMARTGFTELPGVEPGPKTYDESERQARDRLDQVLAGRWEDPNPPGTSA